MNFTDRINWLEEYRALCEKHKLFIEGPYGHNLYVQEKRYPVDQAFEKTIQQLKEDIGG